MIQVILITASLIAAEIPSTCSVQLQVECKTRTVDLRYREASATRRAVYASLNSEQCTVQIINTGSMTITLVEPGDGSDVGWRTPILSWQVQLVGSVYKPQGRALCASFNAMRPEEIFELKPGEARLFSAWVPSVGFTQAGTYKLRLKYENVPGLRGFAENSTPCVAISNEVDVEVNAVPEQ